MTRPLSRRLLALALASALAVPAWGQSVAPFTVSDIRIDGLQRISAGTVFTYLPVERGDTLDQTRAADAIRALYKTGFFEDVRLDQQGSILVVSVTERPAINKLTITGNKDIKTEDLQKGLTEIGLSEGEPAAQGLSDALDGLTDDSLRSTLTIEDGHYRRLEVPLAGLVELSAGRSADLPDLGDSSIVLEIDDAVDSVPVPSPVSDVDLPALLDEVLADESTPDEQAVDPGVGEALADVLGLDAEALDPEDGQLSAEVEALLACYDEATTPAEHAACDATG